MFKSFLKEFKNIFKTLKKQHIVVQVLVCLVILYFFYCFFNINDIKYNLMNMSRFTEGFGVGSGGKSLVYYHMEGCPYCKKFDPDWDSFVSKNNTSVTTRKVDSSDSECKSNGVSGFPTVLLCDGSKNKIKECPRSQMTPDGMLEFCKANQ